MKYKNVFLALMPFWDPLIPPNGISTLKQYISDLDCKVCTRDYTTIDSLLLFYNRYFEILRMLIPDNHHGNLYNSGHDALERHLLAHLNYTDFDEYVDIVDLLIYNTYFYKIDREEIIKLIQIIDDFYKHLEELLISELQEFKPDIFGLTVYKNILGPSIFAFKIVKKHFPDTLTIMGGTIFADSHAVNSPNYNILLEKTIGIIDKIVIGKGEEVLKQILEGKLDDNTRVYNAISLKIEPKENKKAFLPDYTSFNVDRYPYLPVTGSTGCPFKCKFCNSTLFWNNFWKKDTKILVEEMKALNEKYGNQLFFMTDSLINKTVEDLSTELIKNELSLYYDGYFRIDQPSTLIENTLKWRKSGLYRVRIGVESGSQKVLDLMNKKITIDQIKASLTALAYAGIKTTTYWVIGYPGETEKDFEDTLRFVEEMKNQIWQIEPAPFMYQYSGQVNSDVWEQDRRLLYPSQYTDILMSKTWKLETYPSREEAFKRTQYFMKFCKDLGILNPYSVQEHFHADKRWKELHSNSVPSLIEFKDKNKIITENLDIKIIKTNLQNNRDKVSEFSF